MYFRARCIYPHYGEDCEAQCNCSEPLCDVNIGCKAVDEGIIQKSTNIDIALCCFFKKVMLLKCIYVDMLVCFF